MPESGESTESVEVEAIRLGGWDGDTEASSPRQRAKVGTEFMLKTLQESDATCNTKPGKPIRESHHPVTSMGSTEVVPSTLSTLTDHEEEEAKAAIKSVEANVLSVDSSDPDSLKMVQTTSIISYLIRKTDNAEGKETKCRNATSCQAVTLTRESRKRKGATEAEMSQPEATDDDNAGLTILKRPNASTAYVLKQQQEHNPSSGKVRVSPVTTCVWSR